MPGITGGGLGTVDTRPSEAFGTLVRRFRVAAGLTQEELAELAGISRRSLGDLERGGGHSPRNETVALLTRALGLSPQQQATFAEARYRLRPGALPATSHSGPAALPATPFVGRKRELTLLEQHLGGEGPPLLLLAGEPGIGKSRLLHAALPRALTLGLQVLAGGCQRRGGQDPYAPLVGALQHFLDGRERTRLRLDLQGCAWLVRLLPELADGPISPLPSWTLTPEQERRLMDEAVVHVLANVAGPAGTLLLLDDLQWAGPDALDLLALLARCATEIPLRIVGTYRDTEVQPHDPLSGLLADLAQARLVAHHLLSPLAPEEAGQLLDELLMREDEDEDEDNTLRTQILRRASGVPFFVVSCAQTLQHVTRENGAHEAVPWDVDHSVRQRLATLPERARQLAGVAAVIGRLVPRGLLAGVAAQPEEDLVAALDALCHARLLEDRGEDGYQFVHDVIREVVEAGLGAARRDLLHRRIAQVLEHQPGELPVEALAYHYSLARDQTAAAHWLEHAGDRAAASFANASALEHYTAARDHLLALGTDGAGISRLDEKLGDLHLLVGDFLQAHEYFIRARNGEIQPARRAALRYKEGQTFRWRSDFPRALAAFSSVGKEGGAEGLHEALPPALLADAESTQGEIYVWQGNYDAAMCAADWAIALLAEEHLGKTTDLARSAAIFVQGQVAAARGEHARAEELYGAALAIQDRYGDQEQVHRTLLYLGLLAYDRGRFEEAETCLRRGLTIGEQLGNQRQVAVCWHSLSMVAWTRGDLARAEECAQKGRTLSERIGHQLSLIRAWENLGQISLLRGDLAGAETCFQREVAIAASISSQSRVAGGWLHLGLVASERGEVAMAIVRFRAARRLGRQLGAPVVEAGATIAAARARLRQGRQRAAALLLARGRALAERQGWAQPAMQAAMCHVELLLCRQEVAAAREAAMAAAQRATVEGRRSDEAIARRLLGQCALAQGEHAVAEGHLRIALALQTEIGAALEGARTRLVLASTLMCRTDQRGIGEEAHALLTAARSQFIASGALLDLAQADQLAAAWTIT